MAHALRKLLRAYRQVIVLHHLLELPVEQAARELGILTGTVKGSCGEAGRRWPHGWTRRQRRSRPPMDEPGPQQAELAELAEEATGAARAALKMAAS